MNHFWIIVMSFSILPAALIGAIRFRVILKEYRPFVYITWLALLNECISMLLTMLGQTNALNNNFFVLAEALLFVWQMYRWSVSQKQYHKYLLLCVVLFVIWLADMFVVGAPMRFNSLFRMVYSLVLVLLAIDRNNFLLTSERQQLFTNAQFLICLAVIIYFSYKLLLEILFVLRLPGTPMLEIAIYRVMAYINVFCNSIFGIAALCLPTKRRFTLPC